jgi:acetoacetate decarboxylase
MYRGWIQGFPKKLGSIHMTRTFAAGQAAPRIEAGARFGATCAANDRQVARLELTLEHPARRADGQRPAHAQHPPLPAAAGPGRTCSSSCAPAVGSRRHGDLGGCSDAAPVRRHAGGPPGDRPREMLRGYRFSFGYTVDGVEVVAQHDREEDA